MRPVLPYEEISAAVHRPYNLKTYLGPCIPLDVVLHDEANDFSITALIHKLLEMRVCPVADSIVSSQSVRSLIARSPGSGPSGRHHRDLEFL